MTGDQIRAVMPRCNVTVWSNPILAAVALYGLDETRERAAAFLATIAHESAECRQVRESTNYSASALMAVFGRHFRDRTEAETYARQPERIANRVYANRNGNGPESSGDGWRYRGRGLIMVTGQWNYGETGERLGLDLIGHPELLEQPAYAALSAADWFVAHGCSSVADAGDFQGVSGIVNCGRRSASTATINRWSDRLRYYNRAMGVL